MITDLQTAVAERLEELRAEPGLHAIEILSESKGDLASQIAQRLQKASVGLTVLTPAFRRGEQPDVLEVDVSVVLTENVMANHGDLGTKRTATEILELLYAMLHAWQPEDESWSPLQFVEASLRDADDQAQLLIHVATFHTTNLVAVIEDTEP